jgi:hypothetical protein
MGYGLDGGEPVSGGTLDGSNYAQLRTYYYGDAVIGSRGLISPSLATYLASHFRIDETLTETRTTAVPSLHYAERDGRPVPDLWLRSAYATWQGVSDVRLLAPLYVRAGRQYRYGPAIAHFDGLTIGYDADAFSLGVFSGQAVDVTGLPIAELYGEAGVISGFDARLDLYRFNGTPLVLTGEMLRFDEVSHLDGTLALQINRDVALRTSIRTRGGEIARTGVQLRARLRRVTLVDMRLEQRSEHDWMYDLFAAESDRRNDNPLHYFRLGKSLPRVYFEARAGTVLLRNIDVLIHGRGALRQTSDEERSPHATSFAQAGAAVEVHIRRSVNLGAGMFARRYWRALPEAVDVVGVPGAIDETTDATGERSFIEGNGTLRYSQGARKFSAGAEVYLRAYRLLSAYEWAGAELPERLAEYEVRGGGRFSVEGWAGDNLRLKAEYDVTTELVVAPNLHGLKSLRILAEGRF